MIFWLLLSAVRERKSFLLLLARTCSLNVVIPRLYHWTPSLVMSVWVVRVIFAVCPVWFSLLCWCFDSLTSVYVFLFVSLLQWKLLRDMSTQGRNCQTSRWDCLCKHVLCYYLCWVVVLGGCVCVSVCGCVSVCVHVYKVYVSICLWCMYH